MVVLPIIMSIAAVPLAAQGMGMPAGLTEEVLCADGACDKPYMNYESVLPGQPGYQWNDAGGYCGSWATQRATLMQGAYISQGQVRNHTSPGGGNDNEILSTNIDEVYHNLKLAYNGFDYRNYTAPMNKEYYRWLKSQLVQGYPMVWMIMWSGQRYPIYSQGFKRLGYDAPPAGIYGHVEPIMGIQSNHPLTDPTVYDDDTIVHYNDNGQETMYIQIKDLTGQWSGVEGSTGTCVGRYCIGPYSFGWAITGFRDTHAFKPARLAINPSRSEPDIRAGAKPNRITGTLTCLDLDIGAMYNIYRWDTVEDAFTYSRQYIQHTFTAAASTYVFTDPRTFMSNGVTYYRCTPAN